MSKTAIYPGSFDPITNGHLSLIRRSLQIFDKIIVAVAVNPGKDALFSVNERVEMIREALNNDNHVEVDTYEGLTVDYAKNRGANIILRGIRALSDFEFEFQLALMNRRLNRDIQSIFMMTDYRWFYISSAIIKEAASFGGNIEGLVPEVVKKRLEEKFK